MSTYLSKYRLRLAIWNLEKARIPKKEWAGDFLPALRHFITSLGFNGQELSLDVVVGDEHDGARGIPARVLEAIKSDTDAKVYSCKKDPRTKKVPPQAADLEIRARLHYLHTNKFRGLVVIIAGDGDYVSMLQTIHKANRLRVIWIYPYPPRTGLGTRKMMKKLNPVGLISLEDLMFNFHAQRAHA